MYFILESFSNIDIILCPKNMKIKRKGIESLEQNQIFKPQYDYNTMLSTFDISTSDYLI